MAGPWEQYQDTAPADGPWAKYGEAPKPVSIRGEGFDKAMSYTGADQTGGFLRGAGSIGTTLVRPFESATSNADRRANLDSSISQLTGANPDSLGYKANKLGAEVMGTAGVGGLLGNLLSKIPGAATQIPNLIEAIKTGGMTANGAKGLFGLGTRVAGGAVTGGASAGAVNPEDASTGMLVGGTIPAAVKLAGEAGKLTAKGASLATKNVLGMTTGAGAVNGIIFGCDIKASSSLTQAIHARFKSSGAGWAGVDGSRTMRNRGPPVVSGCSFRGAERSTRSASSRPRLPHACSPIGGTACGFLRSSGHSSYGCKPIWCATRSATDWARVAPARHRYTVRKLTLQACAHSWKSSGGNRAKIGSADTETVIPRAARRSSLARSWHNGVQ
jgi:hypothetical protein